MKTINQILKNLKVHGVQGDGETKFSTMEYDSRLVEPGCLFFAMEGVHTDGHDFIGEAIQLGAVGIVHSQKLGCRDSNVVYIHVPDTRQAMSTIAAEFYDHPSQKMKVVGVTGTDGKSSTVSFIHQLLEAEGHQAGFFSTVNYKAGGETEKNPYRQSTPEAIHIHRILRDMVDNHKEYAILEATSHGLSERNARLKDVDFNAAVITNVTHEHLEFHGTVEQYRLDKANLFKMIAHSSSKDVFGVVNADDPWAEIFMGALEEKPVFLYSLKDREADLWCSHYHNDEAGIAFTLHSPDGEVSTRINIPGLFNVENVMAALLVVSEILEMDIIDLADHIPKLRAVAGRMTPIEGNMPFSVLVDYAHTPGAFQKLLPMIKGSVQGRLILVFGSAGERDLDKRPEQGELADQHGDIIILCDEDPRGEHSLDIIEDIKGGIRQKEKDKDLFLIPNRREAMEKALDLAQKGDMVLTLGKGHESSIIYEDGPRPWDEEGTLRQLLLERGYKL